MMKAVVGYIFIIKTGRKTDIQSDLDVDENHTPAGETLHLVVLLH